MTLFRPPELHCQSTSNELHNIVVNYRDMNTISSECSIIYTNVDARELVMVQYCIYVAVRTKYLGVDGRLVH